METKKSKKKDLYFTILSMLKDASGLVKIRSKLGISKQSLYYYLSCLAKEDYIINKGHGVWEVKKDFEVKKSPQGTKDLLYSGGIEENDIRGHAFMVTLRLPKIPNWEKRKKYLDKKEIQYATLHNLGKGQKILLGSSNFHIKSKSIVLYENKSFFEKTAIKSKSSFAEYYLKKIQRLERIFGVSFKRNGKYWFKLCREHYGLVKNTWAKQVNKDKEKITVYDEYGLWFSIDNSLNLNEAEVMSTPEDKTVEVTHFVQGWMNDHKKHEFKVGASYVVDRFNTVADSIEGLIKVQEMYSENARSHVAVIRSLGLAVNELRDEIKKMREEK